MFLLWVLRDFWGRIFYRAPPENWLCLLIKHVENGFSNSHFLLITIFYYLLFLLITMFIILTVDENGKILIKVSQWVESN